MGFRQLWPSDFFHFDAPILQHAFLVEFYRLELVRVWFEAIRTSAYQREEILVLPRRKLWMLRDMSTLKLCKQRKTDGKARVIGGWLALDGGKPSSDLGWSRGRP